MLRFLFQNSRIALAFVVLTVLAAAAIIGPQGNGGLVKRAVSLSEGKRGLLAEGGQAGATVQAAAPPSVFGDYNSQAEASAAPAGAAPGTGSAASGNPMTAPLAPGAMVAPPGPIDPILPDSPEEQQ